MNTSVLLKGVGQRFFFRVFEEMRVKMKKNG